MTAAGRVPLGWMPIATKDSFGRPEVLAIEARTEAAGGGLFVFRAEWWRGKWKIDPESGLYLNPDEVASLRAFLNGLEAT